MAQATLSIRVDAQDKKKFETFCKETGMNPSVAVNMFVKRVIREQKLPFTIEADPFYSEENMNRLRASIENVKCGKSVLKEHDLIEVD